MKGISQQAESGLLPAHLWASSPGRERSSELTPTYIIRYWGVHSHALALEHPLWELLYLRRGRLTLHSKEGETPVKSGTACLIPPGFQHREYSTNPTDILWVGLQGTRLKNIPNDRLIITHCEELTPLAELLWERSTRLYDAIGAELDGLTQTLCAQVLRLAGEHDAPHHDLIDTAVTYMNRHFDADLSISDVANHVEMSEGHFYRLFRKRTGQTPRAYLIGLRLQHARRWLQQTKLSVERIARMSGFRDPLYFSRAFRKHFGIPPSRARHHIGTTGETT